MNKFLIAASALAIVSMPAHAQLLGGGGGLGGVVGGTLGGAGSFGQASDPITGALGDTIQGSADTQGSQNVNVRKGTASADRSAGASGSASTNNLLSSPIAPVGGSASGSGNASGQGDANAQLIGTDTVSGAAGSAVGSTRSIASSATGRAGSAVQTATGTARSATGMVNAADNGSSNAASSTSGNAAGSATGSGGASTLPLAAAGSSASTGAGAFTVAPGMDVMSTNGQRLGKVRQVVANDQGQVQQVVVKGRKGLQTIPANNLAANGDGALVADGTGSASAN